MESLVSVAKELRVRCFPCDEDRLRLVLSLTRSGILIDRADRWICKDTRLAPILTQLKDAAYDAENRLADIDYDDQQKKSRGEHSQASQLYYNSLNIFSNLWKNTAKRVRTIQERLDTIATNLKGLMHQLDLHGDYRLQANRQTSSFLDITLVCYRKEDREKVIKLLGIQHGQSNDGIDINESVSVPAKRRNKKNVPGPSKKRKKENVPVPAKTTEKQNVSVVSIYGLGGVGKTFLAQIVYNDQRVADHFDLKIWICISDNFDVNSLSKKFIDKSMMEFNTDLMDLDSLQVTLKEIAMAHRFLLILDDVWNEDCGKWQQFFAPLSCGKEGSMILVTTRTLKVASIAGTVAPIHLEGLSDNVYREFFMSCAFRLKNPKDYPKLEKIGIDIAAKLKGSPLAAKTLGTLLNKDMDEGHWTTILNSELWELPQEEGDILPSLRLSYQCLLPHLKRCFSFCSIFPKDHDLDKSELVSIWVALDFVIPQGNMRLEDIATTYLLNLTSNGFFQQSHRDPLKYVMPDLIHDLAQFVSVGECLRIDKDEFRIRKTVRHLSICCTSLGEKKLMELGRYNKLCSIIILCELQPGLDSVIDHWFRNLPNIRCLKLSFSETLKLPESISKLKHLRYLDVSRTSMPKSLQHLNNLRVLSTRNCGLDCFPEGFTGPHNLRIVHP